MFRRFAGLGAALLLALTATAREATWLRVTEPDFTVITPLGEYEARTWAAEFAQYIAALGQFYRDPDRHPVPLTLIVFAHESDFAKYRPLDGKGKPKNVAGFFLRQESWAVAGVGHPMLSDDVRQTLFHEGVHWFQSTAETSNPVWIEEGLAEVFSTFVADGKEARWGHIIEDHRQTLRAYTQLPLEKLIKAGQDDLFKDDTRTSIFYAESWAFVHFLLFGKHDDIPANAFATYCQLSAAGTKPEDAFRQAFGHTYREMEIRLAQYLTMGTYYLSRRPLLPAPAPKVEKATAADVQSALARLAVAGLRWDLAQQHAQATIAADAADPRGYELLGTALEGEGRKTEATLQYEAAIQHGSKDFHPYFQLALIAQNESKVYGTPSPREAAEARTIADRYERAIELYPHFALAYEDLAGILDVADTITPADRKCFEQGAKFYPADQMIQVGIAITEWRGGDREAARARLGRVIAATAGQDNHAAHYSRTMAHVWEHNEVVEQLNELGRTHKYAEAVAFIDERLKREVSPELKERMVNARHEMQEALAIDQLNAALQAEHWADARRAVRELLSPEISDHARLNAQHVLEQLDRYHLGLDAGEQK